MEVNNNKLGGIFPASAEKLAKVKNWGGETLGKVKGAFFQTIGRSSDYHFEGKEEQTVNAKVNTSQILQTQKQELQEPTIQGPSKTSGEPKGQVTSSQINDAAKNPLKIGMGRMTSQGLKRVEEHSNLKMGQVFYSQAAQKTITNLSSKANKGDKYSTTVKPALDNLAQAIENNVSDEQLKSLKSEVLKAIEQFLKNKPGSQKKEELDQLAITLKLDLPSLLEGIKKSDPKDIAKSLLTDNSKLQALAFLISNPKLAPDLSKKMNQVLDAVDSADGDKVATRILNSLGKKEAVQFMQNRLKYFIQSEKGKITEDVNLVDIEKTFMRGNTIDSKLFTKYLNKELKEVAKKAYNEARPELKKLSSQLSKKNLKNSRDLQGLTPGDYELAKKATTLILSKIGEHFKEASGLDEVKEFLKTFHSEVEELFDSDTATKQVTSNFFLRFLNPGISAPVIWDLKPSNPHEQTFYGIWVGKITQNIANKTSPNDETTNQSLNAFILNDGQKLVEEIINPLIS